ncbi:MAG TPA: sterol desaturase family protein [Puia sp.]
MLFLLEWRYGLRNRVVARWKRVWTNIGVALPSLLLLRFVFIPAMVGIAVAGQSIRFGIAHWLPWPKPLNAVLAFLVLDYGNYAWHLLNHKIGWLWRFHLVHHTDVDLDVSTAFRFHFGELIGSLVFRGMVTILSGASPLEVLIYELVFEGANQFQHSNWRLPEKLDRGLKLLIVTPRMHGIHHSRVRRETDSNFSVIFSFWDRLHRTFCSRPKQEDIVIGVPSYGDPQELTPWYLLTLPFTDIRPWEEEHKEDTDPTPGSCAKSQE